MTIVTRFLPAVPVIALLLASAAQADTRAGALVSAEGGYGSNPFFGTGSGGAAASGSVSATPTITFQGPTSSVGLSGSVQHTFFASDYNDLTNWSVGGNGALKLSPRSNISLGAKFTSTVQSGVNGIVPTGLPPAEDTIPLPDPSAAELVGQRSKTLSGTANFSTALSARTSLNLGANVSRVEYPTVFSSDSTTYGGSLAVSRVINSKLNLGLGLSVSKVQYDQSLYGSSRSFYPNVQASLRLSPRLALNVSAGASITEITGVNAVPSRAYFSGNASLCDKGPRASLCLVGSRSVGTTAQQGNSTITALGADYSYALTPRSSISLGAQYSSSKSITSVASFESAYVNGSIGYQHTLTERLSLTANVRYTNPFKSVGNLDKNFYAGAGLSYRFGR